MEDNAVFITRKTAADVLGVSVRTIDRYVSEGHLTKYKRLGSTLFDAEEVRELNTTSKVLS